MANEFIARKGLIVLENGIKVTGSSQVHGDITASGNIKATEYFGSGKYLTDVTASYVEFANIANKPTLISSSAQFTNLNAPFTGSFTGSFSGDGSQLTGIATSLTISGSTSGADALNLKTETLIVSGASNVTATVTDNTLTIGVTGLVSQSSQIDVRNTTGISTLATTGSNTFVGNQIISGSLITTADTLTFNGAMTVSGSLNITGSVTNTGGGFSGSFSGSFIGDGSGLTGVTATSVDFANITNKPTLVSASGQIDHDLTTNFVANEHIDHSTVSISTGDGLSGGGDITTTRTLSLDTGSSHFTGGVKTKLNTENVVSSSGQIKNVLNTEDVHSGSYLGTATTTNLPEGTNLYYLDSRVKDKLNLDGVFSSSAQVNANGITGTGPFAVTSSNTFTGVQTISNTTNSTNYTDGALVVAGGVGIAKDVNISGSLNVIGLLTVASMSTQYVTSSQYTVGTSRVIVNDDDLVRFAGLSVVDSGSTSATGSLLWDSFKNHWIYEREDGGAYRSSVLIAGPKNYGNLGDEEELVVGRIPVATGGDHIDTNLASSSIYIDFTTKKTFIEAGLYVTGAVTASGFSGDGSGLTGVTGGSLMVTGSAGGQSYLNLSTQGLLVSGTNGIVTTVSGQSIIVSGSNATTTSKGVASFNSTNFSVNGGEVTSNDITINGSNVTLGGTRNITLQEITTQGATTTDVVTLENGFVAATILHTSSLATGIAGPVTNQVVASIPTGSYIAAHFNYVINDGTNFRTGTVMSIWNGGNIEYTDTSTNDIGNTTGANFTVDTNLAKVRLKFTVPSGTWAVKTSVQLF